MARNVGERVEARKRQPAERDPTQSYRTAVRRGIDRANADRARHDVPDGHHGPNLTRVPVWGPELDCNAPNRRPVRSTRSARPWFGTVGSGSTGWPN